MKWVRIAYKVFKAILDRVYRGACWLITLLKFVVNGVEFSWRYQALGIPKINVSLTGKLKIGDNFAFKSGNYFAAIGRANATSFTVRHNAILTIGNNVGLSNTAIACEEKIIIGNNVRIGANVVIYDSDFHSLNVEKRCKIPEDKSDVIRSPVIIEEGVFIGSHSTILKGVIIGQNSIVGSASVVTKNIPPYQIWGGNPAKFLKAISVVNDKCSRSKINEVKLL